MEDKDNEDKEGNITIMMKWTILCLSNSIPL